jgi:hypothetical protein
MIQALNIVIFKGGKFAKTLQEIVQQKQKTGQAAIFNFFNKL